MVRVRGMEPRAAAVVGRGMVVGAGTVSAVMVVRFSTEYDSSSVPEIDAHQGSNVASTVGVVPGAK